MRFSKSGNGKGNVGWIVASNYTAIYTSYLLFFLSYRSGNICLGMEDQLAALGLTSTSCPSARQPGRGILVHTATRVASGGKGWLDTG